VGGLASDFRQTSTVDRKSFFSLAKMKVEKEIMGRKQQTIKGGLIARSAYMRLES
jgi:hypothetical protein